MRSVTVVRACGYAVALVLCVLLAAAGAAGYEARGAERVAATAPQCGGTQAGESEQERPECRAARAVRGSAAPPVPGDRVAGAITSAYDGAGDPHRAALPGTGTAGVPWRRSVEPPVLFQVFRH